MQIMKGFYHQLKKGLRKDEALWKAKQAYLDKSNKNQTHPYFWSAFIPIGDMRAVKNCPPQYMELKNHFSQILLVIGISKK